MSGDHLERLEARFAEYKFPMFADEEYDDLRAALAELKQLRAEREGKTGPRCRALTNTRLNLQCDRTEGHDAAHVADLAGMGRVSWHGAAPQQPERGGEE